MSRLMIVEVPSYSCEFKGIREICELVRCGECKYWIDDRKAEEDMGTCGLTHYFTNADDFCSYGVKKGADDEDN